MRHVFNTLAFLLLGISSMAQSTDRGIALFDQRDYEGRHIFITKDWDAHENALGFGIESIRVPKGWEVWIYEGRGFTGDHRALRADWDGNGKHDWRWRNDIGSIRVVTTYQPSTLLQADIRTQGVAVFEERAFRGKHRFINDDWTSKDGCHDYGIESIRVPKGWEVWVYEGDQFTGRHMKLTSDWDGEGRDDWQWRNDIRSLRIIRSTTAWKPAEVETPKVRVYADSDGLGDFMDLNETWTVLDSSEKWNDRISRIDIPPGVEVHVFEHAHYRGRVKILKRDWKAKKDSQFWNDRISSIKVITSDYVLR
jgi:hypothetical protein